MNSGRSSTDIVLHQGPWRLRLAADMYPDSAMVRPLAFDNDAVHLEETPGQSTIQHGDYSGSGLRPPLPSMRATPRAAGPRWSGAPTTRSMDWTRHQNAYASPAGVPHEAFIDGARMADRRLKLRLGAESAVTNLAPRPRRGHLHRAETTIDSSRQHEELCFSVLATYVL